MEKNGRTDKMETMGAGAQAGAHTLVMEGRTRAMIGGVTAVSCFNDQEVVLDTQEGEVAVFGRGLHIDQLSLEDGRLLVTGEIDGVEYTAPKAGKARRGLFGRRGK